MIIRVADAVAGVSLGTGVVMVAVGIKTMPAAIDQALGPLAGVWAIMLIAGSLGAAIGSLMRPATVPGVDHQTRRNQFSLGLEYMGWLLVSGCSIIYAGTTAVRFGLIDGAISVGVGVALGALAFGRWWPIQSALMIARKNKGRSQ